MRRLAVATVAALAAAALASCGENENAEPSDTPTTIFDIESDSGSPSPSESESAVTPPDGPEPKLSVTYADGTVSPKPGRVEAQVGELVAFEFTSDVADEVHVHGYEVKLELQPGKTGRLEIPVSIPGDFEVELEEAHELLFTLRVQ